MMSGIYIHYLGTKILSAVTYSKFDIQFETEPPEDINTTQAAWGLRQVQNYVQAIITQAEDGYDYEGHSGCMRILLELY